MKPGGNPDRIELAFSEPVKLDHGDLLVAGMRQHKPKVLQEGLAIASSYRITDNQHVQIGSAPYDHAQTLLVDPVPRFSSFLGVPGNEIRQETHIWRSRLNLPPHRIQSISADKRCEFWHRPS